MSWENGKLCKEICCMFRGLNASVPEMKFHFICYENLKAETDRKNRRNV